MPRPISSMGAAVHYQTSACQDRQSVESDNKPVSPEVVGGVRYISNSDGSTRKTESMVFHQLENYSVSAVSESNIDLYVNDLEAFEKLKFVNRLEEILCKSSSEDFGREIYFCKMFAVFHSLASAIEMLEAHPREDISLEAKALGKTPVFAAETARDLQREIPKTFKRHCNYLIKNNELADLKKSLSAYISKTKSLLLNVELMIFLRYRNE